MTTKPPAKRAFPAAQARRYLEPGPIVLISSAHNGEANIMTCGWHMMLGYDRIGCYIWSANHSHRLIRDSRECVINVPAADLASTVVRIGNCSGRDTDKFAAFGLAKQKGREVAAPLIAACPVNIECRLADASLIDRYELFVFDVVAARAATKPRWPRTIHYRGDGAFMLSGAETRKWRRLFRPDMLEDP